MYSLSNQALREKRNPQSSHHNHNSQAYQLTASSRATENRAPRGLHQKSAPTESSERLSRSALILTRTALSTTVRPTTPQLRYLLPAPEMAGAPKTGSRDAKPLTPYTDQISVPWRQPLGLLSVEVPPVWRLTTTPSRS